MPPKTVVTKEQVLDAAIEIIRAEGADAVTARSVAAKLGVSTHPIFTYYSTLAELKADVLKKARSLYHESIKRGMREDIPFLGVGHQYLMLSKEDPEIFKLLFLTTPDESGAGAMEEFNFSLDLVIDFVMERYNMDRQTAENYYMHLWLMSFGYSALIVTHDCPYTIEQMSNNLTQISLSLCKAYKEIPGFLTGNFDKDKIFTELVKKDG